MVRLEHYLTRDDAARELCDAGWTIRAARLAQMAHFGEGPPFVKVSGGTDTHGGLLCIYHRADVRGWALANLRPPTLDLNEWRDRKGIAAYLTEHGYKIKWTSLAMMAARDEGPPFVHRLRHAWYRIDDATAWAESRKKKRLKEPRVQEETA